jgi:hypothetical protein
MRWIIKCALDRNVANVYDNRMGKYVIANIMNNKKLLQEDPFFK